MAEKQVTRETSDPGGGDIVTEEVPSKAETQADLPTQESSDPGGEDILTEGGPSIVEIQPDPATQETSDPGCGDAVTEGVPITSETQADPPTQESTDLGCGGFVTEGVSGMAETQADPPTKESTDHGDEDIATGEIHVHHSNTTGTLADFPSKYSSDPWDGEFVTESVRSMDETQADVPTQESRDNGGWDVVTEGVPVTPETHADPHNQEFRDNGGRETVAGEVPITSEKQSDPPTQESRENGGKDAVAGEVPVTSEKQTDPPTQESRDNGDGDAVAGDVPITTETQADPPTQESTDLGGGEFVTEGIHVNLKLTKKGLSWTNLNTSKKVFLEWSDVIRCHRGLVSSKTPLEVPEEADKDVCFTLHYIEKRTKHIWKHRHRVFFSSDSNNGYIVSTIKETSTKNKPKRMLVLINPLGGMGKGEKLYFSIVAPLFKLAQIETEVIVSKNPNHPDEIGETYDFSSVDSVVIVGGDGTLQKLIHTWIPRIHREKGVDIDDPRATLHPLPCTLAIIPTGTGNGLANGNYGCADVTTAALNIISGRKVPRKLMRLMNGGKHVGFAAIIIASGAWADILEPYEQARNQGFFRKQVTLIGAVFKKRREFNVHVDYLPIEASKKSDAKTSDAEGSKKQEWVSAEGPHTGVIAFPGLLIPNRETGKSSLNMVKPGMTMILETQCGLFKYMGYAFKVTQLKNDMFVNNFTSAHEVMSYKYRMVHTEERPRSERDTRFEGLINFDGEMRRIDNLDSDIEVSYYPDILEMYGSESVY